MLRRLRLLTAGESHGPGLVALLEGIPAGLRLDEEAVTAALARRQRGYGRGGRMKIEHDRAVFRAGLRQGRTMGSPLAILVDNRDARATEALTRARPGHADLAGGLKLDTHDLRDVLERASARETAARVAAGAVAEQLLAACGVTVFAHVTSIGSVAADLEGLSLDEVAAKSDADDLRCADPDASRAMKIAIREAAHAGDTLGGVFEMVARGHPAGLGTYAQWDQRLDARLAAAVMSIQAVKGVEIGLGFEGARRRGSEVHDPIVRIDTPGPAGRFARTRNHAGGLEGGVTNGEPLVVRAAMKPISTLKNALPTVDVSTGQSARAAVERSDICAVAAASCVGQAMVAIVVADALLEKLGGDSMTEVLYNLEGVRGRLERY